MLAGAPGPAAAGAAVAAPITADESLRLAFPRAQVHKFTAFVDDAQATRVRDLAGDALPTRIVQAYAVHERERLVATAYVDTHVVRTLGESLLVVVSADARVQRIEVLSFAEPPEYLPNGAWYAQFKGRELGPGLSLKGDIRGVTGASLTAAATTRAVRRVLALHRVLAETASR